MPVKYFAPKVTVKLCIIDFSPRDKRGQNNEQSECSLPPTASYTHGSGLSTWFIRYIYH
jgi:hypothetical protein